MDDVFVYYTDLPGKINEMITPCYDGYTIYIDRRLPREAKVRAYRHAMSHVINDDFHGEDVQIIEARAHK
jgi:hypothetical protein